MALHKRIRMIVAMLVLLGVVVAVVFHVRAPQETPVSPAEQPATTEVAKKPADTQRAAATQANEQANGSAPGASTSDSDASPTVEEVQRQADAAIPQAERPKIDPDAEFEPDVVLVSVPKGTTAAELAEAIKAAGIESVEHDDVEVVVDGVMMLRLAPGASIDDAIYDLESSGVAKSAQPNYLYEVSEELVPASDEAEVELKELTESDDGEASDAAEGTEGTEVADATDVSDEANDSELSPGEAAIPDESTTPELDPEPTADPDTSESDPADPQPTLNPQSGSAREALNDTYASNQWNLDSIDALDAWEFAPLKNATTTVGVGIIDFGFGDSHEDIVNNVRSTYHVPSETENVSLLVPSWKPEPDHGSHVAGIVAATSNNEKGVGGVGFNHLKLSLLGLLPEGSDGVTTADVVRGFDYLLAHKDQYGIRVANMSLGGRTDSLPKDDIVLNKIDEAYGQGIVTVCSAGNQTSYDIPPYINYPSDYETVVAVMNLRNTDPNDPKSVALSPRSNFNAPGETSKNISAPGTDIYSTYQSGYGEMSGTSMAAPHVAGVVGLMFVVNPTLSAPQAKSLLYNSARDIGAAGWDETFGYGEVNAGAAVRAAAADAIAGPEYVAVGSGATYTVTSGSAGWSFSSSNPNVLEVSADGTALAVTAGTVSVSASDGSSTIAQQVTVLGPITGNSFVAKDGSEALSIVMPDGCGDLAWEWSSSDESLATVTNNGMVHGKDVGTVTITATLVSDPNVTLRHTIAVYDTVQGDVYLPVGGTAVLTPSDAGGADISWTSANVQAVTVNQDGEVTAMRAGGAAVSCTIGQGDESVTKVWRVFTYGPIEGAASVAVRQSTQLKVAGIDQMPVELQTGWTWSLADGSDGAVASVDGGGKVTGNRPGTVTITATRGAGEGRASFSHDVQVTTPTLAGAKVTIPRQVYSGKKLTPVPVVELNGATLTAGTDYDVVDQDIVNVSSYNVVIRGKGAYRGEVTGIFVVEPLRLTPPKAVDGLVYNGKEQTGVPAGDGYTLSDDTATDAGVHYTTAEVTDKTNTCWNNDRTTCRISWSIAPRSMSEVSVEGIDPCVYDGSDHTPKPKVTWNGMTLEEGLDYELEYEDNVDAGTATVVLKEGLGNFEGEERVTFSILPAPYSVGEVTASEVRDSLDPADVVLTRADTSQPGRLAITEGELSYGTHTYHWSFTPDNPNYAPSSGTVEVTVTKTEPGKIGWSVVVEGNGPNVKMVVPDGLVESMLSAEEQKLVAGGTDALLVVTVRWLDDGEVPAGDLSLLAQDCEARKVSLGWEAYLDISLRMRVGDAEREVTEVERPLAFEVEPDPEGKDAVSQGLAQAIADGKVDGSVTARRVHGGVVDTVGSARKGETVVFESDRFSTYALGSAAKQDAGDKPADKPTGKPSSGKLPQTSDNALPVVPIVVAGVAALALGALVRRMRER